MSDSKDSPVAELVNLPRLSDAPLRKDTRVVEATIVAIVVVTIDLSIVRFWLIIMLISMERECAIFILLLQPGGHSPNPNYGRGGVGVLYPPQAYLKNFHKKNFKKNFQKLYN